MQHPNKNSLYCLSYPRSGSSWFRYCFAFITGTDTDKPGFLCHSHWQTDKEYKIENCYDVASILLLRNYKEAIFSEIKNNISTNPIAFFAQVLEFLGCNDYGPISELATKTLHSPFPENAQEAENAFFDLKVEQYVNDFLLSDLPTFSNRIVDKEHRIGVERLLSHSLVYHHYFALQLRRYYELLEYHNKVVNTNSKKALLIKYEDFIQNSPLELNNMIDFMKSNNLISPKTTRLYKTKLDELNKNIEVHQKLSIIKYRSRRHLGSTFDKDVSHSSEHRKEFLIEIDNVLKNKNLELYNQYLSDYEEKVV